MLRNKIIPLLGAAFLVTACGGGDKIININKWGDMGLISDSFDAKKGEKITFKISLVEKAVTNMSALIFLDSKEGYSHIIDVKQPVEVTFNDTTLTKYDGGILNFMNDSPENIKNKFALPKDDETVLFDVIYCVENPKIDDKVSIAITSSTDKNGIQAMFVAMD
ncbi:MAG: hypothetical protein MJ207_03180 [Bacilli bacterium]|nr:hypothetical protein [Bacilli bacterium]